MKGNILIIDDEEQLRKLLSRIISLEGFKVLEAGSIKSANETLRLKKVDVVLCDVRLPDGNGVEYVAELRKTHPGLEVILLTAFGNIADGVLAIKNGAFDYITKGDDNNRIIPLLFQAVEKAAQKQASAIKTIEHSAKGFDTIIGKSESLRKAIGLAEKIAAGDATVLLLGETGTGKEVFAQTIHQNSKRSGKPMIAINCSAFSKELLVGELFGHRAGAYTGALKDSKGLLEAADGGTLFLDEIGEMDIELQSKLLRVLENGEFIRLGDSKSTRVDIRIIAATNRDLQQEISKGRFREDLYYRLNVFSIIIPALRDRKEDIPVLTSFFLDSIAKRENKTVLSASNEAVQLLQQYSWKGNIRELKNVLERAAVLVDGTEILPADLPYEIQKQNNKALDSVSLASVEKQHIQKILRYSNGNKTQAARLLEIGLATLYRKLEEYQLQDIPSK